MTTVRMMLPVQEHTHAQPCAACGGRGVTGSRYEMQTGAAAELQAPEVVLLLEVFCVACGGCGNGDSEHAGCEAAWHPDPGDDEMFDLDELGDPDDVEQACFSCGSGRGWFPIQGFTGEGDNTVMYTLRGLCGCATDRLVPEGGAASAAAVHTETMSDEMTGQPSDYAELATAFIAASERHAALGLPELPDDPAAAAAMRAAGYEVLAEVKELDEPALARFAIVRVLSEDEDEDLEHVVVAQDVATVLSVEASELVGRQFIATLRETPETGPVLSWFRPVPTPQQAAEGREMTVRCLLLVGDQAELVPGDDNGLSLVFNARWPAVAIAAATGLPLEDLPGRVFRARVAERDGRVLFSGFTLPS